MANAIVGALRVVLGMDSAAFEKGATASEKRMKAFERRMNAVAGKMKSIGNRMSVGITAPLMALAYKSVDAMKEQEQAIAAVDAVLESMGDKAGFTSEQLQDMASSLQEDSLFGDEEILKKVTANILTFGNISGDVFARTQQMALDLSARLGSDLQGSAVMLGKALNDPITGLTALSRVGVSFTEEQKKMIKGMAEAGNVAGAQALMLDLLEEQYKGQAAALANTDSGKIKQAMNAIGDALEKVGAVILPILADMSGYLKSAAEWFQELTPETQAFIVKAGALAAALGPAIAALGLFLGSLKPIVGAIMAIVSPIGLAVLAIGGLSFVIYNNWERVKQWAADIPRLAGAAIDGISAAFGDAVASVTAKIQAIWTAISTEVKTWPARMRQAGADLVGGLIAGIRGRSPETSDAMIEAGRRAYEDFMADNEIKSPSRRYARLGAFLMDGLALGIKGGSGAAVAEMAASAEKIAEQMKAGAGFSPNANGVKGGLTGIEALMKKLGTTSGNVFENMGGWLVKLAKGTTTLKSTLSSMLSNLSSTMGQNGFNALGGFIKGGMGKAGGGLVTGILGGLLGFANGGSFEVGGTGGVDSQIVAFRASPDERVSITKPGQVAASGGGVARVALSVSVDDDGKLAVIARNEGAAAGGAATVQIMQRQAQAQRRA